MSQNTVLLQGRYRVKSILGTGGFSTIYLAVDETTGAEVSIKEFTAEHMDGLATALRVNAYDIANRSEPQPVPDPSDLSGEEKLSRGLMQVRREAQMLELFSSVPGVPGCFGTFQENNTFYLVKEYLEGMTCSCSRSTAEGLSIATSALSTVSCAGTAAFISLTGATPRT